ncbi:hypothetical protein Tco_0328037 [Tanacetum coccineum]
MDTGDPLLSSSTSKVNNINGRIPSNGNDGNRCMNLFASILKDSTSKKTMKIVELRNNEKVEGADVAIPLDAVDEIMGSLDIPGLSTMAGVDVDTLTMEQYLALSRENQAPGVVKPEIGGNVNFKIKSQFMRELREDTFFGNKDVDAHDHIDRVLNIVGLFNILGFSKDAVMLRVFPFTLTGSAKRWVDRLAPGTINTWDLLKKAFIQRPGNAIQTMADHSQKWHDETTSRNIRSSSSKDGLATLVGCQICEGPHLNKDCPLNEEVKQVEEVRYGEFGRTTPFNRNNGGKFHVGPPRYYTKVDNRLPYGEKRQSLEELLAKHQEESARRSTKMEVWIKNLQENAKINTRNKSASLKNLETQIEQLTKEIYSDKTHSSSSEHIKTVTANHETSGPNKLYGVSFISGPESASINVMPRSIFEHLHLTNLKKINMLCEMADMSKKAPLRIVENVLVKIDKFLFPSDFLADEYELGIGKKGYILDNIWEYCNQVHNKNYEWHNYEFKNEECEEIGIEDKDYHPPEVQVETFEVKKYSFKGGQSFICVTKDVDNILPLGRKNGSKFKEMIRKEVENKKT